jgi:outer membrane protein assembly factor BamB
MNLRLPSAWLVLLTFAIGCDRMAAGEASDWPQFLGPTRNGIYSGTNLAASWPKPGPPKIWQKKVGHGFSGPVVTQGRLILFHRIDDRAMIECLDLSTGKGVWQQEYPTDYTDDFGFDDGPRATPSVADNLVYTFGAEGALSCLSLTNGRPIWRVDTRTRFGARKGFFGAACSPLIEGRAVLVNIGGANGAGIVAFDRNSGKLLWTASEAEASYSSPCAATLEGHRLAVFFTREGLVALEPDTGTVRHEFEWRSRSHASVNAATPLVIDNSIFLSASYQTGAVLLRTSGDKIEKVWSKDDVLSNHYATSVCRDGLLYGYDGRQEQGPSLRCVEWQTGRVRWSEDHFGAGTVIWAGGNLLLLKETGELVLAPASPDGFKPTARTQLLGGGVRAYPALADGFIYARNKDTLICVDLRPQKLD